MKKIVKIIFLGLFLLSLSHYSFCSENCQNYVQKAGYTVSAINGIFTDEEGARNNQRF